MATNVQPSAYGPSPRWDGTNAAAQPWIHNNLGYDVTAPRIPQTRKNPRREQAYARANATVNNGKFQWPMFIDDIQIDVALSGSTAQARTTRDFYPHNFVQPQFNVQGQALDQEDYGMLCEFMHYVQQDSISNNGALLQLWIKGGGIGGQRNRGANITLKSPLLGNKVQYNQTIRGGHNQILCQGFVTSMPRQHSAGVVSPTYTFSFAVAWMIHGIYSEQLTQVQQQKNWVEILQSTSNMDTTQSLVKENNKILGWVKHNSANIIA